MAVNMSDFKKTSMKGLYKTKVKDRLKGYKYLARIYQDGKEKKKILGYFQSDNHAFMEMQTIKEEISTLVDSSISLKKFFDVFMTQERGLKGEDNKWLAYKERVYKRCIDPVIGSKQIKSIKEFDIHKVLTEQAGKNRTQKAILEVLTPVFKKAIKSKLIKENPCADITIKREDKKRMVKDGAGTYRKVYDSINEIFNDDPLWKSFFLFALSGRRGGEIKNLRWQDIDFATSSYWLTDTKSGERQRFTLWEEIKNELLKIPDDRKGEHFIYHSPNNPLVSLTNHERQLKKIKKAVGMDDLNLHYFRHLSVSMLAEQGVDSIYLSSFLGHQDANTIKKYLSLNYTQGSKVGLEKIEELLKNSLT
ncbi:MAG: tyrosine-type recombinase/integrase [Campylobacterales bacterium]